MGISHCMLIDEFYKAWSFGENKCGNLGTGDNKTRLNAIKLKFFLNKRVIDVACGDLFSVFIVEVYELDIEE